MYFGSEWQVQQLQIYVPMTEEFLDAQHSMQIAVKMVVRVTAK